MRNAEFVRLKVTMVDAWRGDWAPRNNPITPTELFDRRLDAALIAWLLSHYDTLREGYWPDVLPEEIPSHGGAWRHGWFENAVAWGALAKMRQEACGDDGVVMWLYYHDGEEIEDLARRFHQRDTTVCRRINKALAYCSGWKNKRQPYEVWRNNRKRLRSGKQGGS